MNERSGSPEETGQRPELSWQKAERQEQYSPVAQVSESERANVREIRECVNRVAQHLNGCGDPRSSLAEEAGGVGPQRRNRASQDRQEGPLAPADGNAESVKLEPVDTAPQKTPAKAPEKPSPTRTRRPSEQRGAERLGVLIGTCVMRQETGFKFVAQAGNGGGLRQIDGAISRARQTIESGNLAPGTLDIGKPFRGGHALEIRQEDAQRFSRSPDCHKTVTFKDAVCVVQGKGRKAKDFASENPSLRRCQRRPKLCLGETYADLILPLLGCIACWSVLPGFWLSCA